MEFKVSRSVNLFTPRQPMCQVNGPEGEHACPEERRGQAWHRHREEKEQKQQGTACNQILITGRGSANAFASVHPITYAYFDISMSARMDAMP